MSIDGRTVTVEKAVSQFEEGIVSEMEFALEQEMMEVLSAVNEFAL